MQGITKITRERYQIGEKPKHQLIGEVNASNGDSELILELDTPISIYDISSIELVCASDDGDNDVTPLIEVNDNDTQYEYNSFKIEQNGTDVMEVTTLTPQELPECTSWATYFSLRYAFEKGNGRNYFVGDYIKNVTSTTDTLVGRLLFAIPEIEISKFRLFNESPGANFDSYTLIKIWGLK